LREDRTNIDFESDVCDMKICGYKNIGDLEVSIYEQEAGELG
jgi:hypothetical protein